MSITLTFHNFSERSPDHGQEIIYLRSISSFGSYGFDPRETTVEYLWELIDSGGNSVGSFVGYENGDTPPESDEEGCIYELRVSVDGSIMEDGCYWCSVDEWFDSLPKE